MISTLPRVTIVTVSFNAVRTIEETILSVINQTYPNIEYIVVDGGSTDGTVDVIKRYQDKITHWISEPDSGIYDAMNKGIFMATGDWINFRNCGDTFAETDSLFKVFQNPIERDVMIVHCNCFRITDKGKREVKPVSLSAYRTRMPIIHPATFVRLELHKQWLFDTSYKIAADYNMIYHCIEAGYRFIHIDEPIVVFPYGGVSDTNWRLTLSEMMRIQKRFYSFGGIVIFLLRYTYIRLHYLFLN